MWRDQGVRYRGTHRRTLVVSTILLGRVALLRIATAVARQENKVSPSVSLMHHLGSFRWAQFAYRYPIEILQGIARPRTFAEDIEDPGYSNLGLPLRSLCR